MGNAQHSTAESPTRFAKAGGNLVGLTTHDSPKNLNSAGNAAPPDNGKDSMLDNDDALFDPVKPPLKRRQQSTSSSLIFFVDDFSVSQDQIEFGCWD